MDKTDEVIYFIIIPCSSGVLCILFALWLLPENCSLFISNVPGPQMCHTIPMPEWCDSNCKDTQTEFVASIIAGIGIGLFFIPAVVSWLMKSRNNNENEQVNLFE